MQLILETETTADISVKMTTLEESLDIKLNDSIEVLCNGNKENMECHKNIIENNIDNINSDQKLLPDIQSELPSTGQDTFESEMIHDKNLKLPSSAKCGELDLEVKKDCTREQEENSENSNKNTNSSSKNNTYNTNGDEQNNKEHSDAEKVADTDDNTIINEVVQQVSKVIGLSSKDISSEDTDVKTECDDLGKKEDLDEITTEEDISNNTAEITESLKILDKEIKENGDGIDDNTNHVGETIKVLGNNAPPMIDQVDISEIVPDVDKTITEMETGEDMLDDVALVKENKSECATLTNGVESDDLTSMAEKDIVRVEPTSDGEKLSQDVIDLDQEKVDDEDVETKVPIVSEINETEAPPMNKENDDVVIHSVLEQNCEVSDSKSKKSDTDIVNLTEKVVKDDAHHNAENDQTMTELDTSKTDAKDSSLNNSGEIDCTLVDEGLIQNADDKIEVLDVDEIKNSSEVEAEKEEPKAPQSVKPDEPVKHVLKLSNTLDILSDDDEDNPQTEQQKTAETTHTEKQCINIEDDDDIMLIDEDTDLDKKSKPEPVTSMDKEEKKVEKSGACPIDLDNGETIESNKIDETVIETEKPPVLATPEINSSINEQETAATFMEAKEEIKESPKPLLPDNFLKSCKKNLGDMTRDELEEFCILKIVESIVDRSSLGEIKSKLKLMAQSIEEHKKKAMMLTKQNRDLQIVIKSVQEDQKKKPATSITPLKITRSVGMQVLMTEKVGVRKKPNNNNIIPLAPANVSRNIRTPNPGPRPQKQPGNQQIPVPRLVPAAANPVAKSPITQNSPVNSQMKAANQFNGARMSPPVQKAEKRPHNRLQSVTVDLTDDEPPAKIAPRISPAPPVRLVSPQNLLATPRPQSTATINSPRKVYIPISGPQGQNIRPGQTIMLKSVPSPGPRQRNPVTNIARGPSPNMVKRIPNNRHPAPLPDAMKQYQPPNWKALPPAPDLKLSKVENGIVISWKIEGYQEDSYEEIASYQLYAYQETSSPPSTSLWKKIGDVKALPLPMACTLTQFMAGFKYYFAVRAVDVKSRLGPFSLPGSILLLNKM